MPGAKKNTGYINITKTVCTGRSIVITLELTNRTLLSAV